MYEYSSNTLVLRDSEGKKLSVKSICQGYMVAAVYLDKRRRAEMPTRECRKPAIYRGRMSLKHNNSLTY